MSIAQLMYLGQHVRELPKKMKEHLSLTGEILGLLHGVWEMRHGGAEIFQKKTCPFESCQASDYFGDGCDAPPLEGLVGTKVVSSLATYERAGGLLLEGIRLPRAAFPTLHATSRGFDPSNSAAPLSSMAAPGHAAQGTYAAQCSRVRAPHRCR